MVQTLFVLGVAVILFREAAKSPEGCWRLSVRYRTQWPPIFGFSQSRVSSEVGRSKRICFPLVLVLDW